MRTVITQIQSNRNSAVETYVIGITALDEEIAEKCGAEPGFIAPDVCITALPQHVRDHLMTLLIAASEVLR